MADVRHFTLASDCDGLPLAVTTVEPASGAPVALVQLAHGMAEHRLRYLPFMTFLAEHGFACVINDHRGHGGSVRAEADLGYFYAAGAAGLIADMRQLTLAFRARHPGLKLFLFGHSMGSLAVRSYRRAYDGDIDGLIVCGSPGPNPAAGVGLALNRALTALRGERHVSPLFARMATGGYARRFPDPGTPNAWLSVNRENVRAYDADPLCGFPFTLNGYRALLTLLREAYDPAPAGRPGLPVHFVSGADDPCAPDRAGFEAALRAMRDAGYRNVTAKLYPGMRHEILNEDDRQTVYDDLLALLRAWLPG